MVELREILASIRADPLSSDLNTLRRLVLSREIEDFDNDDLFGLWGVVFIALQQCWTLQEFSHTEDMMWEITSCLLSLPLAIEDHLIIISRTITKEFCCKCKLQPPPH